jgi:hypothetical protein
LNLGERNIPPLLQRGLIGWFLGRLGIGSHMYERDIGIVYVKG